MTSPYLDVLKGLLEGEGHTASNDHGVDLVQQVLDQLDLVRDLGTSQDGEEGLLGLLEDLGKELELLLHQQTGSTDGEVNADDRRVSTVSGTESIVDVDIPQLGERGTELEDISLAGLGDIALLVLDLALLLDVEAQILQKDDLAAGGRSASGLNLLADTVVQELDILVNEVGKLLGNGGQAVLVDNFAIGATEMAHQDNSGST